MAAARTTEDPLSKVEHLNVADRAVFDVAGDLLPGRRGLQPEDAGAIDHALVVGHDMT